MVDNGILLQDAATIATFVAPGYFALTTYAVIYAKREKNFSRLLVESVALSLPIVALANWIWDLLAGAYPQTVNARYVVLLLAIAVALGALASLLRVRWPVKDLVGKIGLGMPDEDFIRAHFAALPKKASVTVTLRSGKIFSGTPGHGGANVHGLARKYYFSNIAWYDKTKAIWKPRPGGIIVNLDDVEHIETPSKTSLS